MGFKKVWISNTRIPDIYCSKVFQSYQKCKRAAATLSIEIVLGICKCSIYQIWYLWCTLAWPRSQQVKVGQSKHVEKFHRWRMCVFFKTGYTHPLHNLCLQLVIHFYCVILQTLRNCYVCNTQKKYSFLQKWKLLSNLMLNVCPCLHFEKIPKKLIIMLNVLLVTKSFIGAI